MNYASGVWGFRHYDNPQVLQNRIMRFFLGVHRFAPIPAIRIELDWLECRESRWLNMLRLYNRINQMDDDRLPSIIYKWDKSLDLDTWYSEIRHIAAKLGLEANLEDGQTYDLTSAYNKLLKLSRQKWHLEAQRKPKLRTFLKIHNFDKIQLLAKSKITRYQRSLLAQLKFGILPLKIETERYQGTPLENRLCKLCNTNSVEDEMHFMFHCPGLSDTRSSFHTISEFNDITDNFDRLHKMLDSENLSDVGKFVENMYMSRKNLMYC